MKREGRVFAWREIFRSRSSSCKDDEPDKRTLMVSLCRNERSIIILGSLYAVLIKIVRLARYLPTSSLYCDLFHAFDSDFR